MQVKLGIKKYIEESALLNEFTCVYTHIPQEIEVFEVRGQMFTMVNMKGPAGLDAIAAVNAFLDKLEEAFFSSHPVSIPVLLDRAVKDSLYALNDYLESVQILDDIIFDFSCAVIKDDVLYICKVEESCIYLIRDNKLLDLGRSLLDISNPKIVEIGSGILQVGDKVILANTAADALVADWSLLSRYSEGEINRLIDPALDGMDKASFIIVELEQEELPVAVTPEVVKEPEEPIEKVPTSIHEPVIPGIGGEIPEEAPVQGQQGAGAKFVQVGDMLGERILGFLSILFSHLKAFALFLYSHRQQAFDVVKGGVVFIISKIGKTDVSHIKTRASNVISEDALGIGKLTANFKKANAFEQKKKVPIIEMLLGNKKAVVPIIIFGLFLLSILFVSAKSHFDHQAKVDQYNTIVSSVKKNIEDAQSTTDLTQIDSLYTQSKQLISKGLTLNIDNGKLNSYADQITQIENSAHHIIAVTDPTVLSDLSLTFSDTKPNGISLIGPHSLLVTSANASSAYMLDALNPSSGSRVSSSLVTSPISSAQLNADSDIIYDKNNGIIKVNSDGSVSAIPGLGDIKNIVSVSTFQENIYMLDATDTAIYKSLKVGDGYSLANPFITDNALSASTSLTVDGNLFVASPSSGIMRYYAGKSTPFKIGLDTIIGTPVGPITAIYTNEHLANMYVLDPQNSRILVLQKPTGSDTVSYNFVRQYTYSGNQKLFNNLAAITVDSAEKNMYVLDGPKVLKISL